MKSGTTSLAGYLGGHPEVYVAPRELHFFDRHFDRGLDWYRGCFPADGSVRVAGESTPDYMYLDFVGSRMAEALPGVRVVAVLRDPVDRAYSHYWHNRTRGHEPLPFPDALAAEGERMSAAGEDSRLRCRYAYLDHGRYALQLARLAEHFSRQDIAVALFEDLCRDPAAVVRRLFQFLGVDDRVVPATVSEVRNRFVTYRSMWLRGPIRQLPGPLRRVAGRLNVRYTSYPPLDADTRAQVASGFVDDNRVLAEWLGRSLEEWSAAGPLH